MKQKKKMIVILVVVCILLTAVGGVLWRFRNSTCIKATKKEHMGRVYHFQQGDEEWATDKLGDSKYTMESSGCLVTCIASAISSEMTDGKITPGELNALFSENNVYDAEGNIQWEEIDKIRGYSVKVYDTVSDDEIEKCLEKGHYPIVRVRMHGLGNFHYVLIAGARGGDYICMDPLNPRELTKLSEYMNRVYAMRCVWNAWEEKEE